MKEILSAMKEMGFTKTYSQLSKSEMGLVMGKLAGKLVSGSANTAFSSINKNNEYNVITLISIQNLDNLVWHTYVHG